MRWITQRCGNTQADSAVPSSEAAPAFCKFGKWFAIGLEEFPYLIDRIEFQQQRD
jgi:hypothetical protein